MDKRIIVRMLLLALLLALPVAALMGDLAPDTAAQMVCPAGLSKLQFTSTSTSGRTRELNASTWCVDPATWEACTLQGEGECRSEPVSAHGAYAAIFAVGWLAALPLAWLVAFWRARRKRTRGAAPDVGAP